MKMNEKGASFVELILVVAAVGFLALLINSIPSAISSISRSRHTSIAREIASKEMDYLRKQTYANLPNGENSFSDTALTSLPLSSASYVIESCSSEICQNEENAKQVKVKVSWSESGDNKSVELATIVGEGGIGQ